jgi:hypothetical protein
VSLAAVAMAVARLLVKHLLNSCRNGIGVLYHWIAEEFRIHRCRQLALRRSRMIGGHGFLSRGLRQSCRLMQFRSCLLRDHCQPNRQAEKNCTTHKPLPSIHSFSPFFGFVFPDFPSPDSRNIPIETGKSSSIRYATSVSARALLNRARGRRSIPFQWRWPTTVHFQML